MASMTAPASKIENATEAKAGTMDSGPDVSPAPRARVFAFAMVVTTILTAANWFVCATWNYFWPTSAMPKWQTLSSVLTLSFVATTILGIRYSNPWLQLSYRISAIWLGFLNFTFFAACAAWIFSAAIALLGFQIEPRFVASMFFGGAILVSIYGLVNASWLRITHVTAKLANLPEGWRNRTVALVTDLHLGNVHGFGLTRRVVARLQQLQPEAVFISGDLFDGSKGDLDAMIEPWKKYSPPAGVYFVTGNHEEFTDRAKFLSAIARAGIRVLNNEKVESKGMQIVGVHDRETQDPQLFRQLLKCAALDRNRPSILLAHQPSNLAIAEEEGISLQVSGHTHGGQIWPWTWVAAHAHGRFNRGLNQFGQLLVQTSNGAGTWGVPMRVGTKSEIVLIRLESSP
jgi:uncharacterized protein